MLNAVGRGIRGLGQLGSDSIVGAARNYNASVVDNLFDNLDSLDYADLTKLDKLAESRRVKNLPQRIAGPVNRSGIGGGYQFADGRNSLDLGRIAAQTGYGRGMQGARYAGQVMKDHPYITTAVVGGGALGTGALATNAFGSRDFIVGAGNRASESYMWPYGEGDPAAQLNPYNQAGAGSGQPLTEEEMMLIEQERLMGMY